MVQTDTAARDPREAQALAQSGQAAMRAGDPARARDLLGRAAALAPGRSDILLNLALAHLALKDFKAEITCLDQVLALEPRDLVALLLKGSAQEELGDGRAAAQSFNAALAVAPPFNELPEDLKPLVRHARDVAAKFRDAYEEVLRSDLSKAFGAMQGRDYARFTQGLEIFLGRKHHYPQKPHLFYFPGLPTIQFYDREDMPWVAGIEAETDAVRAEMLEVLAHDEDLVPYVDYPPGTPLDQWAELNHSHRWSVYHLWKDGRPAPGGDRCPRTMAALATAPRPDLPNRCPSALYSLLKPHTRIPPHTGVTNVRLLVHIPLIVPENCAFRVGNDTRPWKVGEAFIFNDTIEHEAWNESDQNRIVMIFDIWNPGLTEDERRMVTALFASSDAFMGTTSGGTL